MLGALVRPMRRSKELMFIAKCLNSTSSDYSQAKLNSHESEVEQEKNNEVREVYEQTAPIYDLMNDVLSFGTHRIWRDYFVRRLAPTADTRLLDMAGGTGAIAFRYLDYLKSSNYIFGQGQGHVTICDINPVMLQYGRQEAMRLGHTKEQGADIEWLCGDAENLPLDDNSFTAYTISFGIRTCVNVDKVLLEAHRVLKPGGRFMCLEFGRLENSALQCLFDHYTDNIFPIMGRVVAGASRPYHYLVDSIRRFPDQDTFKSMIQHAGFKHVTYENLFFGVCSIHSGYKL